MVSHSGTHSSNQQPHAQRPEHLSNLPSSNLNNLVSTDSSSHAVSIGIGNIASADMQITDDLDKLLDILPAPIRLQLRQHPQRDTLVEVVMDLGRRPEARFPRQAEYLSDTPVTQADINDCIDRVGDFGGDNRAGIEQTLHRISAIRNRRGEIIGLTCRVGRAVFGTIGMIRDLVESGQSILMLGRPGVGKTTALREIARVLADELENGLSLSILLTRSLAMATFLIQQLVVLAECKLLDPNYSTRS